MENHWYMEYEADNSKENDFGTINEKWHIVKYGDVHILIKCLFLPFAMLGCLYLLFFTLILIKDILITCIRHCRSKKSKMRSHLDRFFKREVSATIHLKKLSVIHSDHIKDMDNEMKRLYNINRGLPSDALYDPLIPTAVTNAVSEVLKKSMTFENDQ